MGFNRFNPPTSPNPKRRPFVVVLLPEDPVQRRESGRALPVQEIVQHSRAVELLPGQELLGDHVTWRQGST